MNAAADIIPAQNFETRKVRNFRVDLGGGSYTLISGWGIWDLTAGAWVALHTRMDKSGKWVSRRSGKPAIEITVPMTFTTKKIADQARSEGMPADRSIVG